ncbi:MAG TPA: hypothetical protein VEJ18_11625 [Planctomycetota bacterium]|nr:hypothetical protein [Planctomycetota bacterium]
MKPWAWIVAAALAGCGGVTKQEMDTLEEKLKARDDQMAAQLRSDLTGIDAKYVQVQQLHLKIEKQLEDMAKLMRELQALKGELVERVNLANTNVLRSLEFEEKLMADRLAQLRILIEELKKK